MVRGVTPVGLRSSPMTITRNPIPQDIAIAILRLLRSRTGINPLTTISLLATDGISHRSPSHRIRITSETARN